MIKEFYAKLVTTNCLKYKNKNVLKSTLQFNYMKFFEQNMI